jgi:hypothetical protein
LATEDETIVKIVGETTAVVDLTEMTAVGASNAMIEVDAQTEINGPTVATGIALNAITTILLSDKNAIDAENHEVTAVDKTTIEVSNVANNDRALTAMNARTTEWPVTGIVRNATMITLLGGLNATNAVRQSLEVAKAGLLEGTTGGHSKTVTDVVATEMVATEGAGTIAVVEKPSTTTIGNAPNVRTQILLSDKSAIDVACHETALRASHHVVTTGAAATEVAAAMAEATEEVETEEVAAAMAVATGEVATEEVAAAMAVVTGEVETEAVAVTMAEATEEVAAAMAEATEEVETELITMDAALQENNVHEMATEVIAMGAVLQENHVHEMAAISVVTEVPVMHAVPQENHENSANPEGRVRATLTIALHAT